MKKSIYLAVAVIGLPAFAQNQNRPVATPPPGSTTPRTAPASTTERLSQGLRNIVTDHRLEDLPPAVQKTIREQTGNAKIADIDRETRTGRTVWEVEFEKDGKNTEIHIGEDGTLIPETGASARTATAPGQPATGVGTAAGGQTGRNALSMGAKYEDLPPAIQQRAMQFGGKEKIADIDRESDDGRVKYEIEFKRDGRNLEIEFAEDGTVLESNDPTAAPVGSTSAAGTVRPTVQPAQPTQPAQPQSGAQPAPRSQPQSTTPQPRQ